MSALQNLFYEKKAGIAYGTLNRPNALSALSRATLDELRSVMEDARDDAAVHGVIVTGAGDKAFVAGADITEIASVPALEARAFTRIQTRICRLSRNSSATRRIRRSARFWKAASACRTARGRSRRAA